MELASRSYKQNKNIVKRRKKILAYLFLIVGGFIMAIPFLWMLSTSLKAEGSVFVMPPQWIPKHFHWDNYVKVFKNANLLLGFRNTLIVVLPPVIVGTFMSGMAGYAFAKLRFPGRDTLFFLLLATMMLPGVVTLVPTFVLYKHIGWIDTFYPLMVPGMFGVAVVVFFLRQYFKTIPDDLLDAAKIDGLGYFGIFIKIMLPLGKPALAAQAIFGFINGYNDFMGPLIFLNSPQKFTLQLVLASLQGFYASQWTLIMAGSILALIPTIILFFFFQRYLIEGITMTGLKG